jgi:DNA processing protein
VTSFSAHVLPGQPGYPTALWAALGASSKALYVSGTLPEAPLAVAIVGSRRATAEGMTRAKELAAELASRDVVIVSGGALGIDTAAHRGALAAGGRTVAVLGTGLDMVYPERNRALFDQIVASGGALVSMFPEGTPPRGGNFVARNALIAGLSHAVVVVEAAERSGSLTTAARAVSQGRLVCAVPGSPGSARLLGEGALLVRSADDVLAAMAGVMPPPLALSDLVELAKRFGLSPEAIQVLAAMPPAGPTIGQSMSQSAAQSIDEETLAEALGLTPRIVLRALSVLETSGLVMMAPGRRYRRTASASAEPIARGSRGQYSN